MPLGIDTPSMFALSFGVVGPAYVASGNAEQAGAVGMAVLVIMATAKLLAAFCGEAIRRALPRAALLGALGVVAIVLIMFFPFAKLIAEPVGGFVALGVVLITLIGGRRLKVVATAAYDEFLGTLNWPLGATIAVLLLIANVAIVMGCSRLAERRFQHIFD